MAGKNSMLAFVIFLLIKNNWDNGVMKYYVKRKIWGSDVFIVSIKKKINTATIKNCKQVVKSWQHK